MMNILIVCGNIIVVRIVNTKKQDIKLWFHTIQSVLADKAKSNNTKWGMPQTQDIEDSLKFLQFLG